MTRRDHRDCRNRDYFSRPIQQTGRDKSDYGHTRLHVEQHHMFGPVWGWALLGVISAAFVVAAL